MLLLEHGSNRDNCCGDITYGQPIGKQISHRAYRRIASFNGHFYKEDFLDWLVDLEDLFDFENIYYERKVGLALYELSKYALLWESKNLGPCSGLKYHILSTMRPRRGNHRETS